MTFWLGTGMASWLWRTDTPLMITRRRLPTKRPPRARGPWWLDSGAFTELAADGRFTLSHTEHVELARTAAERIGNLAHVAVQDWLCTPDVLAGTLLTVPEHQRRTLASYLACTRDAPELPWVPTLQGWHPRDYLHHLAMYQQAGVQLHLAAVVGVGSVAGRQDTDTARVIFTELYDCGLRNLHAYGAKRQGLGTYGWALASADSQAWSIDARRARRALCGSTDHHTCRNCLVYAERWAADTAALLGQPDPGHRQMVLL